MPQRNVLVIGPSLAGPFWEGVAWNKSLPSFTVYGTHGSAFADAQPVSAVGGRLVFNDVIAEGALHTWTSNKPFERERDPDEFDGVIFLDPLFLLAGFMRRVLWVRKAGVCPYLLEGAERFFPTAEISAHLDGSTIISSAQWLAIYEGWRQGTVRTLEAIRAVAPEKPVLLLAPACPPRRTGEGLYSYYNLMEQRLIGHQLASRFGAMFSLPPRSTVDDNLLTLDRFHYPDPDPHHPTADFYRETMKLIDFDRMEFNGEAAHPWL